MFSFIENLFIGCFKLTGYFCVFIFQVVWFLIFRKMDKIGDAFGEFGRNSIDAFAGIFKSN